MLSLVSDPASAKESAEPMGQIVATPARKGSKKLKDLANVSSVAKYQTKRKPKAKNEDWTTKTSQDLDAKS
ncbi:unnamed protein product [Calypogeia fissa]